MKISVISVGKLKEKYWRDAIAEYSKRLSRYIKLELIEVADEKAPETMSAAQEDGVRHKEAERILKMIKQGSHVVLLDIQGKQKSSEELSQWLEQSMVQGISHITFVIGGSLGLSPKVRQQGHDFLSFSPMTFPHQMMRVILLEQIYRGIKIMKREPYHK